MEAGRAGGFGGVGIEAEAGKQQPASLGRGPGECSMY